MSDSPSRVSPSATDEMTKYRKKPVVIDAFRWASSPIPERLEPPYVAGQGGGWVELEAWLISLGYRPMDEADGSGDGAAMWINGDESLTIPTLEGDHRCDIGDWIIRGVKGEFYPCKPDIFALTYESAPPSRGSEEELGKLLDGFEQALYRHFGCRHSEDCAHTDAKDKARQSVESYVSQLRGEIETLRHMGRTTREMYEQAEAELAACKEQQLTAREASAIIDDVERRYFPHNAEHLFSGIAKLRLLSTSDSSHT